MRSFGLGDGVVLWIEAYPSGRVSGVYVSGGLLWTTPMRSGVPQISSKLFVDDVKMITEHEPSQFSYCRIRLVEEMVPTEESC